MIRIQIFRQSNGKIFGYHVKGHSQTAEHGRDILCAGVSALTQTILLGLSEQLHRKDLEYKISSGDLFVKLNGEPNQDTQNLFETMRLGLIEIEKINPKAVHIVEIQNET